MCKSLNLSPTSISHSLKRNNSSACHQEKTWEKKKSTVPCLFIVVWCRLIVFPGSFHSLDLETAHMSTLIDQNYTGTWDFPRLIFPPYLFFPFCAPSLHDSIALQVSTKDGLEKGNTFRNSLFINKIIFKSTLTWIFQCHQRKPMLIHHISWCWHGHKDL